MKPTKIVVRQWCLALVSTASLIAGVVSLQSCGGEGGSIGGGTPGGGGGGSIAAEFKALQPAAQQDATYVGSPKCGTCHGASAPATAGMKLASSTTTRGLSASNVYDHWIGTKHATEGVGCEQCHGPGSAHAAAPATDNILTFPKSTNPIVCAQCHGPIYDDWKASKHAEVVPDPVIASANLATATGAQCFMCHSGLVRTKVEEGLVISSLTADQAAELSNQTYNEADPASSDVPFTASCVTCHNPHSKTGNLDTDGEEVQLRHQLGNTDPTNIAPGSTPAQFIYFDQQCAECHNGRGANGADVKLQSGTSRPNMHDSPQYNMLMGVGGAEDSAGPVIRNMAHATQIGTQCSHCHMPNARHTFTVSFDVSCQPCHTADDAAARVASAKNQIVPAVEALEARLQSWAQTTFGDNTLWDYTTLIPEGHTPPNQSLVPIEVKRARHNLYFVIRDGCYGPHNAPYAKYLIKVANDNLDALSVPGVAPATNVSSRSVDNMLKDLQQRVNAAKLADRSLVEG